MTETKAAPVGGSKLSGLIERVKPKRGGFPVIGVLMLVAAGLSAVAAIAYGIVSTRTDYFEQRNLRELDRVAAEINATRESLSEAAALHFVPQQLHFSLSRQLECLVATTQILGARQRPITIAYYFTDPPGSRRIAEWYAEEAGRLPAGGSSAAPPVNSSSRLPDDICSYERPRGQRADPRVALENEALLVERTAQLTSLLWAMTPHQLPQSASACTERPAESGGAGSADVQAFIRRCFELAALEDLRDQTYSLRGGRVADVVAQSLDAAVRSNSVRINVSTPLEALDLEAALEMFDAVQIIGHPTRAPDSPALLYQAGRVPAAVEGEELDEARMLGGLLGFGTVPAAAPGAARGSAPQRRAEQQDFLLDARVVRTRDLVVFQKTVPHLAGLDCNPCRIVGVVERAKFDRTVRKIDGVHATIFLIGVLTLIGLIPLLQLKLRQRLDAMGQVSQYLLWFSLTLLAASAAVSTLAIWSSAASRTAGARYAEAAADRISDSFADELDDTIAKVAEITAQLRTLKGSTAVFPSPLTLPSAELAPPGPAPAPNIAAPVLAAVAESLGQGSKAAIIETVSHFRGDGFIDRDTPRLAAARSPAFGTAIDGRPYFLRARNCEYHRHGGDDGQPYLLDRVFARPDGAPRVVLLMPVKEACPQPIERRRTGEALANRAAAPAPAVPAQPPAAAAPPPGDAQLREDYFYDPTRQAFVVASGSLRTFLRASLAPGFDYAVIDPRRPNQEANVLFHSRTGAELVERFQNEIDDPAAFAALTREVLTNDAHAHGADEGASRHGPAAHEPHLARLDTSYRGRPARLTVARLHPEMEWVLVLIEDRDDAGYAIWRAATFGYGTWLAAVLIVTVLLLVSHLRGSGRNDRRPGLWLWPRGRLATFTPPRIERHERMRDELVDGAGLRDRHVWWVLAAGVVGVLAAEGSSRIILAFAAALSVFAARAYFRGLTASKDVAARRYDRQLILASGALLAASAILFAFAIYDEYRIRLRSIDWDLMLFIALRVLLFAVAVGIIAWQLRRALPHTRGGTRDSGEQPEAPGPGRTRWRRDFAWMAALPILGGLPAAAGFLDSHDYDHRLVAERQLHVALEAESARAQAIQSIRLARILPLPDHLVEEVIDAPVTPEARFDPSQASEGCLALTCLALRYMNLREQALQFSDFIPFSMRDSIGRFRDTPRFIAWLLVLALPTGVLILLLSLFRRTFFRPPPLLSPGKDPDFDPPLSLTRETFVKRALLAAAAGETPALPFTPARGNLHLILGADLDLGDEVPEGEKQCLRDHPHIQWIDLLDPPAKAQAEQGEGAQKTEPLRKGARAVVIGNLDLALQLGEPESIDSVYRRIREIAGVRNERGGRDAHIFLLADIDPLDRIALLWERQGSDQSARIAEGWRWAELIEDFTLFPIQRDPPLPDERSDTRVQRAIREELGVLDADFAHALCKQLLVRMNDAEATRGLPRSSDDEERIISFITEQMSDHYHKLWASSGDEERVMLYRVASDCHLKMTDSRALRSLLARGLLIRVPEYRLMNRSFARYVLRVGAASEIHQSAVLLGGVDRIWPVIRYPLAAIAAASVLLLQFVAPTTGSAAVGALPALVALLPALIGRWFQGRVAAG